MTTSLTTVADQAQETITVYDNMADAIAASSELAASESDTAFDNMSTALVAVQDQADATALAIQNIGSQTGGQGNAPSSGSDEVVAPSSEEVVAAPVGGSGGAMGAMGMMMAANQISQAIAPIQNALGSAISSFASFDQSMRMVNEEAKLSQSGFEGMETSVLNLSNQTGLSANDLSTGLYNIMSTGLVNAAGGMQVLTAAAEGAKAGNASLGDTTKALDSVMGAYGMKASSVGSVLDIMFKATNDGQMKFTDLAKSVGASATSAAIAGVSYKELAASEATLTNVGKNAQVASQELNSLILGIIAPTAGATKEAKSLGIEWDAGALKAHGLSYMINEATKATGGNLDSLKKLVPNVRAWTAVVALGSTAHKLYVKTLSDMNTSSGATEEALKQANQGVGDSIDDMKNSITNAGIVMAQGFSPQILAVSKGVEGLITWFTKLNPGVLDFVAVFGAALLIVGKVAVALIGAYATLRILALVFDTTMGPILIWVGVILGVIAVIALFVVAYQKNFGGFKTFMNGIFKDVATIFDTFKDTIATDFGSIAKSSTMVTGIMPAFESIFKTTFTIIGDLIKDVFIPIFKLALTIIGTVITFVKNHWGTIGTIISIGCNIVAGAYNDILAPVLKTMLKVFGDIINFLTKHQGIVTVACYGLLYFFIALGLVNGAIAAYNIVMGVCAFVTNAAIWPFWAVIGVLIVVGLGIDAFIKQWNACCKALGLGSKEIDTGAGVTGDSFKAMSAKASTAVTTLQKSIADSVTKGSSGLNTLTQKCGPTAKGISDLSKSGSNSSDTLQKNINDATKKSVTGLNTIISKCPTTAKGLADLSSSGSKSSDTLKNAITSSCKTSINTLGTLGSTGKPTGKNLLQGLIDGMEGSENTSVCAEVAKLTADVLHWFHLGFGIRSPSTKTFAMGSHLIQGLINGMSKSNIAQFIKKWAGNAVGAAKGVFSTITNLSGDASSWLMSALQMTGTPTSWVPAMETLMSQESGGNPTAHNPSGATGIAQMMPGTFAANMFGSLNNILNPIDNLCASIDYIKKEYGTPDNIKGLGTSAYKGYAQGTPIGGATAGLHWVGENGAELLNFKGGESVTPMSRMAMSSGRGSTNFNIVVNANGNVTKNETDLANMIQGKIWDKLKSSGKF
jgi:TP901 family phage tail tape measure protein